MDHGSSRDSTAARVGGHHAGAGELPDWHHGDPPVTAASLTCPRPCADERPLEASRLRPTTASGKGSSAHHRMEGRPWSPCRRSARILSPSHARWHGCRQGNAEYGTTDGDLDPIPAVTAPMDAEVRPMPCGAGSSA